MNRTEDWRTGTTARRGRILVAEDDVEMRSVIADALARAGYDVAATSDGGQLMTELARSHRHHYDAVDLVISDIRMPLCSGTQALAIIRSIRPHVRFLLITAFPDAETRRRTESLGVVLLEKPFSMDRLLATVADALVAPADRAAS